ncbi:MAG: hypothetical protein V4673_13970 [Pseudomonadota bacterium]
MYDDHQIRIDMRAVKHFRRLRCHRWKQSGHIALWRYKERNYDGWHLTADANGCESLAALIEAMMVDGPGASRSIMIERPTRAVRSVPRSPEWAITVPAAWQLSVGADISDWRFPETSEYAELCIGADWLPLLADSVRSIGRGIGDYSIGDTDGGNLPLWFWR